MEFNGSCSWDVRLRRRLDVIKGTVISAARLSADVQLRLYWRFAVFTAAMM